MNRFLPIAVCFALACAQPASASEDTHEDRPTELGATKHTFGDYTYVPRLSTFAKVARAYSIQRSGKVLYQYAPPKVFEDGSVWLEEPYLAKSKTRVPTDLTRDRESMMKETDPRRPVGTDITGDGTPDLIVGRWTGGAHCCHDYTIFSLGKQFRNLGTINGLDSSFSFKDLDGDGIYEAIGPDFNFRYWHECFAGSPAPLVILTLKGGHPVVAQSLMKTPPLSEAKFASLTKELKDYLTGRPFKSAGKTSECIFVSSKLWKTMLQLIYTGNGKQAWQLFDTVWPKGKPAYWEDALQRASDTKGKQCQECFDPAHARLSDIIDRDKFIREFKAQLAKSYYWPGLKQMNGW